MGPTSMPRSWKRPRRKYRWSRDMERRTGFVMRMAGCRCWRCCVCAALCPSWPCAPTAPTAPCCPAAPVPLAPLAPPPPFFCACRLRCRVDRLYARSAFANCLSCDRMNAAKLWMYASPSQVSLVVAMAIFGRSRLIVASPEKKENTLSPIELVLKQEFIHVARFICAAWNEMNKIMSARPAPNKLFTKQSKYPRLYVYIYILSIN